MGVMKVTYQFKYKGRHLSALLELCHISKNLYNEALYLEKQQYEKHKSDETEKSYLSYYDLDKLLKTKTNLEGTVNYKLLPVHTAQQCIRLLDKSYSSFFKGISDYKKHPSKYSSIPKCPKYKDKNGYNLLVFTNQQAKIKQNKYIQLKAGLHIPVPQSDKYDFSSFKQIRILPYKDHVKIEIIYERNCIDFKDNKRYASIDLGMNNLCTMVDSDGNAVIYNGRKLKSYNRYVNKTVG